VPSLVGRDQLPGVPVMLSANSSHSMSILGVQYFPTVATTSPRANRATSAYGRPALADSRNAAAANDAQLMARMQEKGMSQETFEALRAQREVYEGAPTHVNGYRDVDHRGGPRNSPTGGPQQMYNTKRGSFWTMANPEPKARTYGGGELRSDAGRLAMTSRAPAPASAKQLTTQELLGLDPKTVGSMSREDLLAAVAVLRQRKSAREAARRGGARKSPVVASGAPIMPRYGRGRGGGGGGGALDSSPRRGTYYGTYEGALPAAAPRSQPRDQSPSSGQRRELYGRTFSVVASAAGELLENTATGRGAAERATPNRYHATPLPPASTSPRGFTDAERRRAEQREHAERTAATNAQREEELRRWRARENPEGADISGLFAAERLVQHSDGAADRDLLRRRAEAGHDRQRWQDLGAEGQAPQSRVHVRRTGSVIITPQQRR
jgi:hypothetical protein